MALTGGEILGAVKAGLEAITLASYAGTTAYTVLPVRDVEWEPRTWVSRRGTLREISRETADHYGAGPRSYQATFAFEVDYQAGGQAHAGRAQVAADGSLTLRALNAPQATSVWSTIRAALTTPANLLNIIASASGPVSIQEPSTPPGERLRQTYNIVVTYRDT
jgi:hypothetical protein